MYMFDDNKQTDLEIKKKLLENTISRDIQVVIIDGTAAKRLLNDNVILDSLEITQSICDSSEIQFGGCISSQLSISLIGVNDLLNNKQIKVSITQSYIDDIYPSETIYPSDELYSCDTKEITETLFTGTIDSSKRQQNRDIREIIAYDNLYLASKVNIYHWLYGCAEHSPTAYFSTIKDVVDTAFQEKGVDIDETQFMTDNIRLDLSTDLVSNVCNGKITVLDLLKDYCEINACFAYCTGDGTIKFKKLPQVNTVTDEYNIDYYTDLQFEDYSVKEITDIRFPYDKDKTCNETIKTANKRNYYESSNKITACCKTKSTVSSLLKPSGSVYSGWAYQPYRPFSADIYGRWWVEVGDVIKLDTGATDISTLTSVVFNKTISGTAGLRIRIQTDGSEYLGEDEKEWDTNQ